MSKQTQLTCFNIIDHFALSAGLTQPEQWHQWAKTQEWPEDNHVDVHHIPPMMRRRMSSLSKLAVQTALELLAKHQIDYLVFASRHGELQRSANLIKAISEGEEASPMAFSQSVHNTAAGLTTIASKKAIPATSIAAGLNTFQSAIIDAWLYLSEHPSHKVLVVDFDEPVPEIYQQYEPQQYQGYALGLVLSQGDAIAIKQAREAEAQTSALPQGLEFLQHYLNHHSEWQLGQHPQGWTWTRSSRS
ncbi:beta-ketoacyl synthase chain length factor [uncultured Vibrio sp.]|uniref:beta-ketoacyl synthase chain length factor n=1 Tax=uncultured Vibrio sp. TaxID=114054 RepID=UPI0025EC08E9|nr:beta-ketoacyl synthase chain length factor [uncultured Vibrio sp.]